MICPQCGYDIGKDHKCLRCGYEVKTLVAVDEEEQKRRERESAKVIDPNSTYLTDEYGYSDDEPDDPFESLLGSIFGFDPFADLLGGLFGFGRPQRRKREVFIDKEHAADERPAEPEVVDVDAVEVIDDKPKKGGKKGGKTGKPDDDRK